MKVTIGQVISRVKQEVKAVKQDTFLTDRFVFSKILNYARLLLQREDSKNKLMQYAPMFRSLQWVPLIEVDSIEADCRGIESGIKFMRTKDKMDVFLMGYSGPLVRSVMPVDGSVDMQETTAMDYANQSKSKNFRFNKTKYYWYRDGHFYFPNIKWAAVKMEGATVDSIAGFNCPEGNCSEGEACLPKQQEPLNLPEYLLADIEKLVVADLGRLYSIPSDNAHDNQSLLK